MREGTIAKSGALGVLALMLLMSFSGAATDFVNGVDCDTYVSHVLYGGQTIDVGDVEVWHDGDNVYVRFTTEGMWWLSETNVWVGDDIDNLPTTGSGAPKIGHFPFSMDHDPMVQMYKYTIDLDDAGFDPGDTLYFATHAVVNKVVSGEVVQEETGWAGDEDPESKRWWWYFDYEPCKVLTMPDDDVTVVVASSSDSYFDTTITNGGNDVPDYTYEGWCFDKFHFITPGTEYEATLISSYDPFLPVGLQDDDWDLVNWILNNKQYFFDLGYTAGDIQNAIWYLFEDLSWGALDANEQDIVTTAQNNGEGFYPGSGQWMAIIVFISDSVQGTFIEVDP
jgi:hypothetical protein